MRMILYPVLIAVTLSCAPSIEETSYRIKGEIEGLRNGIVYLYCEEFKDTSLVENGEFTFTGRLPHPSLGRIEFEGINKYREFYLENSAIEFSGNIDFLEEAIITGSRTEDERAVYQSRMSVFDQEYADLEKEYETAGTERKDRLEALYEQIELEQVEAQKLFVKQYPTSFLGVKILTEIDWSFTSASEYDEYVSLLDPSLNKYEATVYLKDLVRRMKRVGTGETAPDFVMNNVYGMPVRLSELYSRSELLLLDFWASNCAPCRKENANLRAAYDFFSDKGLEILGVSTDTRKDFWLEAIEQDGLVWQNVCSLKKWDENEIVSEYALRQVSQNFLLDKQGTIIATDLRGEALISKLNELLN